MDRKKVLIQQFLKELGLPQEEVSVYLTLLTIGPSTILKISRRLSIPRTQLYRIADTMTKKGFLQEIIDDKRKIYQTTTPESLEVLLNVEENRVKALRSIFQDVEVNILSQIQQTDPITKVIFYRGKKGVQQMAWNLLKAKQEILGYNYRVFEEAVGKAFAETIYKEMRLNGLTFRHIISNEYLKSLGSSSIGIPFYLLHPQTSIAQTRYIPSHTLNIDHQVDIYNDVLAYYNWHEGEVFGVEIHNNKIASMQKQMFEIVWRQALEVEDIQILLEKLRTA